jgi:NADH-quinone oxidoreductase subunit M
VSLSSIGLPGLNGFIGEFLVLVGAFQTIPTFAVIGALGVILAAVYMLWMYQRVMLGEVVHEANRRLKDLSLREVSVLVPVVLVSLWIGFYPQPFLERLEASTRTIVERLLTVASHSAARAQEVRCREQSHTGFQGSGEAGPRRGLAQETCRQPPHRVPETEG